MRSVVNFKAGPAGGAELVELARPAVEAFAAAPGCLAVSFSQCLDEPDRFLLITEWAGVGEYRRGMSSAEVKLATYPLLLRCQDEPSAFGELLVATAGGPVRSLTSDLAEG